MRYIYLLFLLLILNFSGKAQNTGYGGKRVLLKTTILSGLRIPFVSAELEVMLSRKITLSAGYRATFANVKQWYYWGEYETMYNEMYSPYPTNDGTPYIDEKAKVTSKMAGGEVRYYILNYSLPAPRGMYVYGNFYYGKAHIDNGVYYNSLFMNTEFNIGAGYKYLDNAYNYTADVKTYLSEIGVGFQEFVSRRITIEAKGGFTYAGFISPDSDTEKIVAGAVKNYGRNLLTIPNYFKTSSVAGKINPTTASFGISVYVNVGILLF